MIDVGCHSCKAASKMTASEVLGSGRCSTCGSSDIDLASNIEPVASVQHKRAAGSNPFCRSGLHSDCSGVMCGCPCHSGGLDFDDESSGAGKNPFCRSGLHSDCSGFMCECTCHGRLQGDVVESSNHLSREVAIERKISEIAASIKRSNPGIGSREARAIAADSIRQYPRAMG